MYGLPEPWSRNMTNFLVTGGAGNIASALVNASSKDKDNFIVIAENLITAKFRPARE